MKIDPETERRNHSVASLNKCIEVCIDGEKGYGAASADAAEPTLKSVFRAYEQQRADFVTELQRLVDAHGGGHENQGRLRGALHRGWTGARLKIEGRNDEVIIDECIRGETGALKKYDHILREAAMFTPDVTSALLNQRLAIASALEEMRNRLAFPGRAISTSAATHTH